MRVADFLLKPDLSMPCILYIHEDTLFMNGVLRFFEKRARTSKIPIKTHDINSQESIYPMEHIPYEDGNLLFICPLKNKDAEWKIKDFHSRKGFYAKTPQTVFFVEKGVRDKEITKLCQSQRDCLILEDPRSSREDFRGLLKVFFPNISQKAQNSLMDLYEKGALSEDYNIAVGRCRILCAAAIEKGDIDGATAASILGDFYEEEKSAITIKSALIGFLKYPSHPTSLRFIKALDYLSFNRKSLVVPVMRATHSIINQENRRKRKQFDKDKLSLFGAFLLSIDPQVPNYQFISKLHEILLFMSD